MDRPQVFIRASFDGHLGYFHLLVIMNNTAMNICVQVFVWIFFYFLGYIPRSGNAWSHGNCTFNFKKSFIYLAVLDLSYSMGESSSPHQGWNPSLHWECRVSATGPPGKSLHLMFWGTAKLFCTMAMPFSFYIPNSKVWWFQFFHMFTTLVIFVFFFFLSIAN